MELHLCSACYGASVDGDSFSCRARGQRTPVRIVAPPVDPDVPGLEGEEKQDCHEGGPGVKAAGEHVVVPLPPVGPVPEDNVA